MHAYVVEHVLQHKSVTKVRCIFFHEKFAIIRGYFKKRIVSMFVKILMKA